MELDSSRPRPMVVLYRYVCVLDHACTPCLDLSKTVCLRARKRVYHSVQTATHLGNPQHNKAYK